MAIIFDETTVSFHHIRKRERVTLKLNPKRNEPNPAMITPSTWPVLQQTVESSSDLEFVTPLWKKIVSHLHAGKYNFPPGIYIFIYHSVVDPQQRCLWEKYYVKGEVTVEQFAAQLDFLQTHMHPLPLSQVPTIWQQGKLDRPYFVITFDDGYANNLKHAFKQTQKRHLSPTLFINADFTQSNHVFYRVLAAILTKTGYTSHLATELKKTIPSIEWSQKGLTLFNQTKTHYQPDIMEQTVETCFRQHLGNPADLGVHLNCEDIRYLANNGWEMGNHTRSHRILSHQSPPQVQQALEENATFFKNQNIDLIPFVGYPVGRAQDVGPSVLEWLKNNPTTHAIFANGGVNFRPHQWEWLRFGLGKAIHPSHLTQHIQKQIRRTQRALQTLQITPNPQH